MLDNQIPLPPVEMVMPPINTFVAVANFVLLIGVTVWVAMESRRTRSAVPLLILAGAALTSLQEPIYDIVGAVWYPDHGTVAYIRAFNVSIPIWLIPGYAWYIGGLGNYMVKIVRQGVTRPLWQYYFVFWVANFALEMPGLNLGIYRYYGDQPFRVLGFPLWMAVTNGLMPLMVGATQSAAGWPTWLALNSRVGVAGASVAAVISLGLAFCIIYLLSEISPKLRSPAAVA
jgi:hypothetical protein